MSKIVHNKMKKGRFCIVFLFLAIIFIPIFLGALNSIETKNLLLKFSVKKSDSEISKNITLRSETGGLVGVAVKGFEKEGVSVKQPEIIFDKEGEKNAELVFNVSAIEEGVHVGHLEATVENNVLIIPIVFEVESRDVLFDGNLEIPSKYSNLVQGESMILQLNIFDLLSGGGTKTGLGSSSVEITYKVHDLGGNVLISENENFVVDEKVLVTKTIDFPKDIEVGQYVLSATIKYKSSTGTATEMFRIVKKEKQGIINFGDGVNNTLMILIFIAFIFVVLILFFVYIIRDRDKLLIELREFNDEELKRNKSLLNEQMKFARLRKRKTQSELAKEYRTKIKRIKKIQKERIREAKKLRDKGKINEMKKKITDWKKRGYNTSMMELKSLDTKGFEPEAKIIRSKLKDTKAIPEIERDIENLRRKIKREMLRKVAKSDLTKKILEKSKDIEKDRTLMREKISELENEIRRKGRLSRNVSEKIKEIPELENKLIDLKDNLSRKISQKSKTIDREKDLMKDKILELENEIKKKGRLPRNVSEKIKEIPELENKLIDLKDNLSRKISQKSKTIDREKDLMKDKILELENEIKKKGRLPRNVSEKIKEIPELENKLIDLKDNLSRKISQKSKIIDKEKGMMESKILELENEIRRRRKLSKGDMEGIKEIPNIESQLIELKKDFEEHNRITGVGTKIDGNVEDIVDSGYNEFLIGIKAEMTKKLKLKEENVDKKLRENLKRQQEIFNKRYNEMVKEFHDKYEQKVKEDLERDVKERFKKMLFES